MRITDLPKINCDTVYTWRNTKTGETFTKKPTGPRLGGDIVQDCTVTVSPKGLNIFHKKVKTPTNDNKA
jgi:hypothetical protein